MQQKVLVTGGAGFIGSTLIDHLINDNYQITVIDNFDPFYSRTTKEKNMDNFKSNDLVQFINCSIENNDDLVEKLKPTNFDTIVHLAAKAGVRPSIADPVGYQNVNVRGTQNLLEIARKWGVKKFVFASSSSVYGVNENIPWSEDDHVLQPISPYASTKLSGEFLGHVYKHLYGIQFLALRFFTVYGPRQRPDLAIHKFARALLAGKPITMYGDGQSFRDYTYVEDIVDGIRRAMAYDESAYEIINLGNNKTISLKQLIETLELVFGKKAIIEQGPEQPGDVKITYADISKAMRLLGYRPSTEIKEGISKFKEWLVNNNAE